MTYSRAEATVYATGRVRPTRLRELESRGPSCQPYNVCSSTDGCGAILLEHTRCLGVARH
jgi:hypothetical protein